jgi:hypothetical protein
MRDLTRLGCCLLCERRSFFIVAVSHGVTFFAEEGQDAFFNETLQSHIHGEIV